MLAACHVRRAVITWRRPPPCATYDPTTTKLFYDPLDGSPLWPSKHHQQLAEKAKKQPSSSSSSSFNIFDPSTYYPLWPSYYSDINNNSSQQRKGNCEHSKVSL